MLAACLVAPRRFELLETQLLPVTSGDIRFQVESCGVCASNLGPWAGAEWFTYPFAPGAPGHEAIGTVVEVGPNVANLKPGMRVATLSQMGFAEFDTAAADSTVVMPDELKGRLFLGEPLACAVNVGKRAGISPGNWVAVVGLGFLGLILVQLAKASGGRVIGLSSRPESLVLAEAFGAEATINSQDRHATVQRVQDLTAGELCPVVIEAAGHQGPLDLASELTRVRGRLVVAGYHQDGPRTINLQLWNWRGLDVINAHERDHQVYVHGMREALELFKAGTLQIDRLITHRLPLPEINAAFHVAEQRPSGFFKAAVNVRPLP
ncbi:MAG TPA: zinc-binding dehydrogenase [Chthoniobacterales bacterium]